MKRAITVQSYIAFNSSRTEKLLSVYEVSHSHFNVGEALGQRINDFGLRMHN